MKPIPCCEFQTETLFVDDSQDLQLALSLHLPLGNGRYTFMNSPHESLAYLQKQTPLLTAKHLSRAECPVPDDLHFKANLDEIKTYADRPSKMHKIGVVFMDYEMPGMNGLEVFENANAPCLEKILLTGRDEKLAVQAFNRGLINQYISKQDSKFIFLINEAIGIGRENYFKRSTETLYRILTFDDQDTALTDPIFVQFFDQLKKKLNIIEYYLLDNTGSFLMIDANKVRYKLNTYTKEKYQSLLETLPPQHRPVEIIRGRQIYHCLMGAGFTPCLDLRKGNNHGLTA